MKITMIVGDVARVSDGKLDVLGGGWSVTGPGPTTLGIGILSEVAWDEMNTEHKLRLRLNDDKGEPSLAPNGQPFLELEAGLMVPRPPGVLLGTPAVGAMAINVGNIPLPPGRRFHLQATVNGYDNPDACVSFSTRPEGPQPPV